LAACDLHPQEFAGLRQSLGQSQHSKSTGSHQLALHQRDAFEALGALLPPKEKRGLILLDPSYEQKQEYTRIAQAVAAAYGRFRGGVYVIWYPLLPAQRQLELFKQLKRSGLRNILRVELDGGDSFPTMQMHGSGLLIVNPPWHARQAMQQSLNWINQQLTGDTGKTYFGWLVPE